MSSTQVSLIEWSTREYVFKRMSDIPFRSENLRKRKGLSVNQSKIYPTCKHTKFNSTWKWKINNIFWIIGRNRDSEYRVKRNLEKSILWHKHPHHLTCKSDTQGTENGEEQLPNPNFQISNRLGLSWWTSDLWSLHHKRRCQKG